MKRYIRASKNLRMVMDELSEPRPGYKTQISFQLSDYGYDVPAKSDLVTFYLHNTGRGDRPYSSTIAKYGTSIGFDSPDFKFPDEAVDYLHELIVKYVNYANRFKNRELSKSEYADLTNGL